METAAPASQNPLPRPLLPVLPLWAWPIIGGVSALGFAPQSWWPLTVIAFALLIEQSARGTGKRAFWVGWLFGLGHFTIGLRWIAVAFTFQAAMPEWLGYLGVVLIAIYLALFPAVTAAAARWMSKGRLGVGHVLAFAGFWILTEWVRGWLFTGFAWNPLSVIAVEMAGAAKLVGTYGLSGLLLIGIGGLALILNRHWKSGAAALALGGLTLMWHGLATIPDAINQKGLHLQPDITIVQPNISQTDKYRTGYEATNFKKLAANTLNPLPAPNAPAPTTAKPRMIFWPEAAIPWSLESGLPAWVYFGQPGGSAVGTRAQLALLMQPGDVLITGADRFVLDKKGDITGARNSVFAVNSDATLAPWRYDKAHLVPYGEYLPMKSVLKPLGIDRLVPGSIDFLPGPGPRSVPLEFEGRTLNMGVQICYEIIFSGEVVDRANRPDFIFNASNDAWYGDVGPPQFLAIARLRAVEEGLPIIRATPTGISAVINPDGSLGKSLPHGIAGRIDAHLPPAAPPTIFGRYGNIIPLCLAGMLLLLSFVANRRRAR